MVVSISTIRHASVLSNITGTGISSIINKYSYSLTSVDPTPSPRYVKIGNTNGVNKSTLNCKLVTRGADISNHSNLSFSSLEP